MVEPEAARGKNPASIQRPIRNNHGNAGPARYDVRTRPPPGAGAAASVCSAVHPVAYGGALPRCLWRLEARCVSSSLVNVE